MLRYCIFISLFAVSPACLALNLESISKSQVESLQSIFKTSKAPTLKQLDALKSQNCKLFGMRSRMQTTEKKGFYKFSPKSQSASAGITNSGAQVLKEYQLQAQGLVSTKGPLSDVVRITSDGRLISELSIPFASSGGADLRSVVDPGRAVLAYATCD